ncbi:MAG: DUF4102 domain-containing protein [Betaproteobacteria bacterium]|nr:DUF4102 domain-containing protein [Betaproteobacteria bacterium]
MATEKRLTEVACKAAKKRNKLYYLSDGAGLRLRIRPDAMLPFFAALPAFV